MRRSVVITVSLGIALPITAFAIAAFDRRPALKRSRAVAPGRADGNGSIYFRYEDDQGDSRIGVVEPGGTGQRDAFPGVPATQHEQISFSPDGTLMAYVDGRKGSRGIYRSNADGSNAVRLTDQANDSWPTWSPDGTKIAFVGTRFDPTIDLCQPGGGLLGCPTDIYSMAADGSNVTDLTNDPGFEFDPAWSPDGTEIAFASTADTTVATTIDVMNADGTGRVKVSSSNGGSDFDPRWSPDGAWIVFGGIHYENSGLFEVRADGTDERTLLFGIGTYAVAPSWSPDGSLIAFGGNVGNYGAPEAVFVMQPDGSGVTKLADLPEGWAVREIAWRPVAGTSTPKASVVGVFDVVLDGTVSGLTFGFGSLWVDGYENPTGPGHVIRLDPVTGERIADISIGSVAPGWEVGGGVLTTGDGAVWVVGTSQVAEGSGVDTALVRIDPATNTAVDTIVIGGKVAADVAVDTNGVWVLYGGDDDTMRIARIDPSTDRVVATISLSQVIGHFLLPAGGSILAFTNESQPELGKTVVDIIDPTTNTLARSVALGQYLWPAAGDGSVWLVSGTSIETIDPRSGEVAERWPLTSTGDALAVGTGGVWFLEPNERSPSRWNPSTQAVDASVVLDAGLTPNVITTSPGAVWVLTFEGKVVEIDVG